MTTKSIIYTSLKRGDFTLHFGQKSTHLFDIMKLIRDYDFCEEFYNFVDGDFLVGIEFGGAILATLDGGNANEDFAVIRKDGTIYGSPIPKDYVLLDDVVTTENSIRLAIEQIYNKTGYYPIKIKCIVDRRKKDRKSLNIESMLEFDEEEFKKHRIVDRSLSHIGGSNLLSNERVKQKIKELRSQLPEPQKCSLCPNPLFDSMKSSDEEPYVIDGKPVCRDCYFNELGDFIEKNPIWTPFGSLNEHK